MSISVELLWSNDPLPINEIIENPTVVVNLPIGGTIITSNVTQSYVDDQDALLQTQIDTKADQVNLDQTNAQVELNRLSILTKADADAVNQSLSLKADLVGGVVPAAQLPSGVALGETSSTAYRGDRGKIAYDHSQSQGNPHNTTTSDINEGTKLFFTESRVNQTVLTGLNTNTATPALATDNLLAAIGKLQAQINNSNSSVFNWVNATSITGFSLYEAAHQNAIPLKFARKDGMLWISGALNVGYLQTGSNLFTLANSAYLVERFIVADLIVNTIKVTVYYQDSPNPVQTTMDAYLYRNASNMTLKLQYQLPIGGRATIVVFNPMPLGRLVN